MQATELLSRVTLDYGKHGSLLQGACVMESVAHVAGEPHTDLPACACPVVTRVAIYINDECRALRENGLNLRILRLAGSNKSDEVSKQRAYYLADYALRTVTPNSIRSFAPELADAFAALLPVDCPERIEPAHALVRTLLDTLDKLRHDSLYLPLRLEDLLNHLEHKTLRELTRLALDVITAKAPDTDMLALLDDLLDIGDTQAIPVDPQVAQRLTDLVAQRPARA